MTVTNLLSRYITRHFLVSFFGILLILGGIIFLFEFVEILRRTASKEGVTLAIAVKMTAYKTPNTLEVVFPFALLFGAMFAFWRLTRSQELVIARAAGISVWQFLFPVVLAAALVGVLKIGVLNPISTHLYAVFEIMEDRYIRGRTDLLDISRGGLWLRQRTEDGVSVISAEGTEPGEMVLNTVTIFLFDQDNHYRGRIDAEQARLGRGYWHLTDGRLQEGGGDPQFFRDHLLATDLTPQAIQERYASPKTMSFWTLPEFIDTLESTGFSTVQHRLHYQTLMAQPFLLASMVLFAAAFSLRHHRRGGAMAMLIGGILTGFLMFALSDIVATLGLAETIPIILAAWAPSAIGLLVGTGTLLHLEDG